MADKEEDEEERIPVAPRSTVVVVVRATVFVSIVLPAMGTGVVACGSLSEEDLLLDRDGEEGVFLWRCSVMGG